MTLKIIGVMIFLAMAGAVIWYGTRIEENEDEDESLNYDAVRLARRADAPQIDEDWERHEFGQEAPDQQARDKGAV